MRHIERLYKLEILIKKEKEWTEKFIQSGKARPSSKQYAHKDILDALLNISHGKCFYSEKKIEGLPKEVDHLVEVSIDKSKVLNGVICIYPLRNVMMGVLQRMIYLRMKF